MSTNPTLPLLSDGPTASQPPVFSTHWLAQPRRPGSRTPSFSSSVSSLTDSPSSFSASNTPSPFHRLLPLSAVPFSWERQPGIPKSLSATAIPDGASHGCANPLLPLPPHLRSGAGIPRKDRPDTINDPFAAALAECAKTSPSDSGEEIEAIYYRRSVVSRNSGAKTEGFLRSAIVAYRVGLVGLFASCKSACSVSDATIVLPRPSRRATASYGLLNSRSK